MRKWHGTLTGHPPQNKKRKTLYIFFTSLSVSSYKKPKTSHFQCPPLPSLSKINFPPGDPLTAPPLASWSFERNGQRLPEPHSLARSSHKKSRLLSHCRRAPTRKLSARPAPATRMESTIHRNGAMNCSYIHRRVPKLAPPQTHSKTKGSCRQLLCFWIVLDLTWSRIWIIPVQPNPYVTFSRFRFGYLVLQLQQCEFPSTPSAHTLQNFLLNDSLPLFSPNTCSQISRVDTAGGSVRAAPRTLEFGSKDRVLHWRSFGWARNPWMSTHT